MAEEQEKPAAAGEAKKRKLVKGRHKSAIKRHRQSLKRAERNQSAFSSVRTAMKKVKQAVASKDAAQIRETLRSAMSLLHKASSKGLIHSRNASRQISRLSVLAAQVK
jgi:small subunit ribosomal protein S20